MDIKVSLIVISLLMAGVACGGAPESTPQPTVPPEFDRQDATFLVQENLERGEGCVPPYNNWWGSQYWREDYQGDGTWSVYWADPGVPGVRYEWTVAEQTGSVEELQNPYPELC